MEGIVSNENARSPSPFAPPGLGPRPDGFLAVARPGGSVRRAPGDLGVAPATTAPNIVMILADDQRYDELSYLPNVQNLLMANGVTFTNAFVSNPDCCPSRASTLTGESTRT